MRFGAAIGALAKRGRDKLTIVTHPAVDAFGAWAEQLIAESTGKSGTGIVPIEGEPLGAPSAYGERPRLRLRRRDAARTTTGGIEPRLDALERAGHPVIRLAMSDTLDIGEQFYLWEIATAAAGAVLGHRRVRPAQRPGVQGQHEAAAGGVRRRKDRSPSPSRACGPTTRWCSR